MNRWGILVALPLALALTAGADTSSKLDGIGGRSSYSGPRKSNKKFAELEEISDAETRARAGSRSKYSIKAILSYYGSSVSEPFEKDLPNPDNSPGAHKTSMSGSVSGRYRIDKFSTLGFGSGVSMLTPFHGVERFDMKDPYLAYDSVYRTKGGVQAISSASLTYVTNPDYLEIGELAGIAFYQSGKYRLGKWTVGMALASSVYYYDRGYIADDRNASNYFMTLIPSLSYKLSRKLKIKSSISRGIRNLRKENDWGAWDNRTVTQKLGLGIAVTKDIYINPYLYFYPEKFSWKNTSVSFSTIFSVL